MKYWANKQTADVCFLSLYADDTVLISMIIYLLYYYNIPAVFTTAGLSGLSLAFRQCVTVNLNTPLPLHGRMFPVSLAFIMRLKAEADLFFLFERCCAIELHIPRL